METETIDRLPAAVDSDESDLPDPHGFDYQPRSKLDPDDFSTISEVLRNGGTKGMAASAVGVTRETLMTWHNRGRQNVQDDDPMNCYGAFYLHAERAMNQAKASDLSVIREAGEHDWRARKWFLEKVYPSEFADVEAHIVDRPDDSDGYRKKLTEAEWRRREQNREEFIESVEAHVNDEE